METMTFPAVLVRQKRYSRITVGTFSALISYDPIAPSPICLMYIIGIIRESCHIIVTFYLKCYLFYFWFSADVEIQWNGLRTCTSADGHASGHNGRVRCRGSGRASLAPPLGRPPPDDRFRRSRIVVAVVVGRRAPAQQTVVLRHPVQGRVRQDDIRPTGQGVRGLLQPVQRTAAPLPMQVRMQLSSATATIPNPVIITYTYCYTRPV